jgi:hypothetical protein
MRRLDKIFKTMALFIGTREAEQCRSHHQKMEKKYSSFANIAHYLRKLHYDCDHAMMMEDMANHHVQQRVSQLGTNHQFELEPKQEGEPAVVCVEEAEPKPD